MLAIVVIVAAVLVALGTSLLKQVEWSTRVKATIAVVLSVVGGAAVVASTGGFDNPTDVLATATLVYGAAQAVYAFILKGTVLNDKLTDVNVLRNKDTEVTEDTLPEDVPADQEVVVDESVSTDNALAEEVTDVSTPEDEQVD